MFQHYCALKAYKFYDLQPASTQPMALTRFLEERGHQVRMPPLLELHHSPGSTVPAQLPGLKARRQPPKHCRLKPLWIFSRGASLCATLHPLSDFEYTAWDRPQSRPTCTYCSQYTLLFHRICHTEFYVAKRDLQSTAVRRQ